MWRTLLLPLLPDLLWPLRDSTGRLGFNPRSNHTKNSKNDTWCSPCLTLSIIRYWSRVNWSNTGNGVASSATPRSLTKVANFSYFTLQFRLWVKPSSSSYHATSTDLLDPLSPHVSIVQGYILYRHSVVVYRFLAGCPAFARPCEGVYRSMSLMSSPLLLR